MKTPIVAVLLFAVVTSLGAQQPAAPDNPITAAFKGRITRLSTNVAQAFDSIPEAKFGYKPTPAQLTIGYIAQHVAEDNYLFCNAFGDMKADVPADEASTPDSVKATWPKAKLVQQLRASFDFGEQASMTFRNRTRSVGRAQMVLGHALDLADHYSQLANYMRLNGILPPTALPRPQRGGGE
jgi:uncharacterized protein YdeI (BOF family)